MTKAIRTIRFDIRSTSAALAVAALALLLSAAAAPLALAGPPIHTRVPGLDIAGLNHACGVAVDSKGDVYLSSAGESKVKVFSPAHTLLTTIPEANEPCGLAVNSKGELFVSERALGNVVRFKPNAFPFAGAPSYGAAEPIDSSGNAKGIAVDPVDDRLYVAEGSRVETFSAEGKQGIDEAQRVFPPEATGGTFTLTFEGQTTAPIAWDASHAAVQSALEVLPTIGAGNVLVRQELQNPGNPRDHEVVFVGALGHADVDLLTGDPTNLTGAAELVLEELVKGFNGHVGEGELTEATGVAAFTSPSGDRHLYVADPHGAGADRLNLFRGTNPRALELQREILGPADGELFDFDAGGAYLAVDPGNRGVDDKCVPVAEQACTAGHLLVYDASDNAVDEFDASGGFLDQIADPSLGDARPTALAIERSGGPGDGTIYATAGEGAGAKALAFGPLAAPSRAPLPERPPSHALDDAFQVATDPEGYLYALTQGNRIHVFSPTGVELAVGAGGEGIDDPKEPESLSVDSVGRVYVVDSDKAADNSVTYYTPSAYPPVNGTAYVRHEPPIAVEGVGSGWGECGGIRVVAVNPSNDHVFVASRCGKPGTTKEFDSAASGHESALLNGDFAGGLGIDIKSSMAVNGANGNVYFASFTNDGGLITAVNALGTKVLGQTKGAGAPKGKLGNNPVIAVDESNGHVLAFENGNGAAREYDAGGAFVAEFAFPEPQGFTTTGGFGTFGIAIDNSDGPTRGRAYVAFDDPKPRTPDIWAFAPLAYGEAPAAETGVANDFGSGGVTLNGAVNPRGFDTTECRFEYLLDSAYLKNSEEAKPAFEGATSVPCAQGGAEIGKGSTPVAVSAAIPALAEPEGRYRFHLVVKNKYGEVEGAARLFGPPVIVTRQALPTLYTEATLRANVDPSGLLTRYRFQYGKSAGEYDQETPVGELAPGAKPTDVSAALTGMAEGTTYHFRVVAENEDKTVEGPDQELTTLQRSAQQDCANAAYRTGLSANLPDCRAYELVTPAETNGLTPTAEDLGSTFVSNYWAATPRGAGAGERLSYFTFGTLPGFDGNGIYDGYRAQRAAGEHPATGWSSELFGPTYEQAVPDVTLVPPQQLGLAADQLYSFWRVEPDQSFPATLPAGTYLRTPAGFEPVAIGPLGSDLTAESRYLAAGGAHVIFSSEAQLSGNAPPPGTAALYDRLAGSSAAQVLSLRPDGSSFDAGEAASYRGATEDGAAIAFTVGGNLYLNHAGQVVEVAAVPNALVAIGADGDRVYYSDSTPGGLYLCETSVGSCAGPEQSQAPIQIAAKTSFATASADGSRAFFVSTEALTPPIEENENEEAAGATHLNLYSYDAATQVTHFVAQLDPHDFESFGGQSQASFDGSAPPVRTSPDGSVLLFASHARLSGYDSQGKGEIYRYNLAAPHGGRLLCVSCDPGQAPAGADALLVDLKSSSGTNSRTRIANLTDDGSAVFFLSTDRLLPEDANAVQDVYEWQAEGAADCSRIGGCLGLISSGQGEGASTLYGMSAEGHDVFFRTREKLVGADVAGSSSIYDARIAGGIPDPVPPAACQGDACQGNGAALPALPVAASTGAGEGNEEPQRPTRCTKGKHRIKGRCVVRHPKPRQHKRKHGRAGHERKAQR
jgi:hypothetical protein